MWRDVTRRTGPSRRRPTVRGAACVVVYTAALVAVTLVGFASLPRRVERPIQRALLAPAAAGAARVDWTAHRWLDDLRRTLGTDPRFRAATRAVLDDAVSPADEAAGYVATVDPPADRDPVDCLERALAATGFHRNPTAYLEYRDRAGREFERSSWVLRSSLTADRQLHVRLFDGGDGTVDVYGHWERSVTAGGDHYERPDYRTGVGMTLAVLKRTALPFERRASVGGVAPRAAADTVAPPVPSPGP